MDNRRVVVTGIGAVTPLGNDIATTWDGIINGRSGLGPITRFPEGVLRRHNTRGCRKRHSTLCLARQVPRKTLRRIRLIGNPWIGTMH